MHRRSTTALLTACALAMGALAATPAAHAQAGAALPAPRFGIMAGVNSSNLAGDDIGEGEDARRTGFIGGVYLSFPLGAVLSLQPELLYSMKGAGASAGEDAVTFKSDYVEVPVLLRASFAPTAPLRPFLFAGPTFSFRTRCELEGRAGGLSASIACDDFADANPGEDVPEFKRFDLGAALGGGVALGIGTASTLNLGVRYTIGTSSIADPGDVKNRVISVTAGLEFPFGGR